MITPIVQEKILLANSLIHVYTVQMTKSIQKLQFPNFAKLERDALYLNSWAPCSHNEF